MQLKIQLERDDTLIQLNHSKIEFYKYFTYSIQLIYKYI